MAVYRYQVIQELQSDRAHDRPTPSQHYKRCVSRPPITPCGRTCYKSGESQIDSESMDNFSVCLTAYIIADRLMVMRFYRLRLTLEGFQRRGFQGISSTRSRCCTYLRMRVQSDVEMFSQSQGKHAYCRILKFSVNREGVAPQIM